MTPQEKAIELVKKYKDYSLHHNSLEKCIENAKQCALIAVNEIINIVPSVYLTDDEEIHSGHYQYWNEVKAEIEKL